MRAFRLFIAYSYVPDFRKEVGDFFWESEVCVESKNMDLDNMLYRGFGPYLFRRNCLCNMRRVFALIISMRIRL